MIFGDQLAIGWRRYATLAGKIDWFGSVLDFLNSSFLNSFNL
jgi:hypothetical protein